MSMALEPVSSDPSAALVQVEKESPENLKTLEEENEKAKVDGIPTGVSVPSSEPEEKTEENESKPPIVEDASSVDTKEKPKAVGSQGLDVTSSGPEELKEGRHIERSPHVVPDVDILPEDNQEVFKDRVAEIDKRDVSGGTDDSIRSEAEAQPENKDSEKPQETIEEKVAEKPQEQANKIELPDAESKVVEAKEEQAEPIISKPTPDASKVEEQSEPIIHKEPDVAEVKDAAIPAGNEKNKEDAPIPASGDKDLSKEKPKITEESKESVEAEPIEKIEIDAAKDKETTADKVEEMELRSEVDPIATTQEAHVEQRDTQVPPIEVPGKIDAKDPLKTKEEAVETEEEMAKDVKSEDKKVDRVMNEELAVPEATKINEVTSSLTITQDSGKVSEAEQASRDIELPADTEGNKDETIDTAKADKVVEVEKKVDVEETPKSETGTILENAKPDDSVEESLKEIDNAKTTEEATKQEASVKQKHSNNILSKLKQSFVKAKKAIIKKNPSKAPPAS